MDENLAAVSLEAMDALPNPVFIKDEDTRYVWVNQAFEALFAVDRQQVRGELDVDLFPNRQAAQCNGGDLRVLRSGKIDDAEETIVDPSLGLRQVVTRKSRIVVDDERYLVGVLHDITVVTDQNRKLSEATSQLVAQAVELERLATTDPLTDCVNRRAFLDHASDLLTDDVPFGVVSIDLDHFKEINDEYGHAAGDAVLVAFSEAAREVVREGDIIARMGGEEFTIALRGASVEETNRVAERVRAFAEVRPVIFDGQQIHYTVSIGAAVSSKAQDPSVEELLRIADERLYQAKASGRNMVRSAG